jgi:hypothetical protein
VKSMGYLGAGDTCRPVLTGSVTTEKNGTEEALQDVTINLGNKAYKTDREGRFRIAVEPGKHGLVFHKTGYQDLVVEDYNADSNEHSEISVTLFPGSDKTVYHVGKDKIKSSNHLE